jgi:hypothetical protein
VEALKEAVILLRKQQRALRALLEENGLAP